LECDDLLMERDDLEKRVADLEHQLAEQRRAGPGRTARSRNATPWRMLVVNGRVSVIGAIFVGVLAAVVLTLLLPFSALWTSGIVCDGGSHLAYSESFGLRQGTTRTFQCVNGESSYVASKLVIYALQAVIGALVVYGAAAAGLLAWRRSGSKALTSVVVVFCLLAALLADLVFVATWQDSLGPTQVPSGGKLSVDEAFTNRSVACNDGELRIGGILMTVKVTGRCRRLTVDGIGDDVTVENADSIISGGIANSIGHP
jgi:Protein of unknown function (DUF3060)